MRWLSISVALVIGGFVGCTPSGPPLTPVSGRVTLDDKALAGAVIRFYPLGDVRGHGGTGRTGDDGKYEVIANRMDNRKGLLPGEYKVIVSRLVAPDGTVLPPDTKTADTAALESVPAPYSDALKTPLTVTIGTEAKTFDIPLKK